MNRTPSDKTKPPMTAVKRVDFFRQKVMITGDIKRERPKHKPAKQPVITKQTSSSYPRLASSLWLARSYMGRKLWMRLSWPGSYLTNFSGYTPSWTLTNCYYCSFDVSQQFLSILDYVYKPGLDPKAKRLILASNHNFH